MSNVKSMAIATTILLALIGGEGRAASARNERVEARYQRALRLLESASADSQRAGLSDLEEASRLAPERKDIGLALARACLELGRFGSARASLERIARRGDVDFDTWFMLGMTWKLDWLQCAERPSLDKASHCLEQATRKAPDRPEGWTASASIALLRGQAGDALRAAHRACHLAPENPEPTLMLAAALYRLGALSEADSAFLAARARFRETWLEFFAWEGTDPDLTTPENEAELDGLTRWALARFLFRDGDTVRWDQRAELFVRYGPPANIEYDPVWAPTESAFPRHAVVIYAPDPIPFSFHTQVWHYPQLGIDAFLWDRSLRYSYQYAYSNDRDMDPVANPALVGARADLIALEGGRGVFRALPPAAEPLSLSATVNRFPVGQATQVVTHLFSPGSPADSLWGSWAVADSQGRVVHRGSGPLSVSACDPAGERLAEFATQLSPGNYRVDVAVQKGARGRGVAHLGVEVGAPAELLAMSDLVLICGDSPLAAGTSEIRISPNVEKHVERERSIALYYELDRLGLGPDGMARFEYVCTMRQLERRGHRLKKPVEVYEATREEENIGAHRRQFVTIPVASLANGTYEARITVKDLVSRAEVQRVVRFTKGS